MTETRLLILGGGLAGLSTAHHYPGPSEIFEAESGVGGHCRTKTIDGFAFDEGAHVFFGEGEAAERFVWQPLAADLVRQEAEIWNNYGGTRFGRYPVQTNAHALPPELAASCVLDFIEEQSRPPREVGNYEEWCVASFGRTFAEQFMLRYARKVWTVEPSELGTDWLGSKVGGRISRPSLEQVVRGAIDPAPQVFNYLTKFAYPAEGGFARIVQPLRDQVRGPVHVGNRLVRLETNSRRATFADGTERVYEQLVSTIPLPRLVACATDVPERVRRACAELMWTSVRCVNIALRDDDVGPGHWCYFYDEHVPFFRISFPHRLSRGNVPAGCASISAEIAYSRRRELTEESLEDRVVDSLLKAGVLKSREQVLFVDQVDLPFAYVVFDFRREAALTVVHDWMTSVGILPCGRFSEWGYHWSFEAIESGQRAADRAWASRRA